MTQNVTQSKKSGRDAYLSEHMRERVFPGEFVGKPLQTILFRRTLM